MLSTNIMKLEQLQLSQFSSWYPLFSKRTIKSCVIPLSSEFAAYLQTGETLVLPKGVKVERSTHEKDWEEAAWETNEAEEEEPDFPEIISELTRCIAELGGNAFPKLNWSAPRDASWINNNSLKCSNPGEVLLLLKSSDFVQHDLATLLTLCEESSSLHQPELILRKWANLSPGMEFRCFVRNKRLIGISQRQWRQYFDFIESDCKVLSAEIHDFIRKEILDKLPLQSFVVDVYKKRNGRYWIIDFNPFLQSTDSLLFEWSELSEGDIREHSASVDIIEGDRVLGQFRYADKSTVLQPSEYLSSRIPVDFVDLSTGSDATKLVDFMRMKIQATSPNEDSDSDEEEWSLPS